MIASPARRRTLAMLVSLALPGCTGRGKHAVLPRDATVIALGDSLTYGTGASPAASYPALLAARTGWRIHNAGVPGDTASQACARLPDLVATHRPALVLVLVGGNDFLRRLPDAGIREALAACVGHARDADAAVAVIPVPRPALTGLADAPLYAETARALDVPLIDAGLSELLRLPAMRADAVHLNADGYRAMAERVANGLVDAGWLR
jgi:acyl-CoA thioesterase-1